MRRPLTILIAAASVAATVALAESRDRGAPAQTTPTSMVAIPAIDVHRQDETVTPTATIGPLPEVPDWCNTTVPTPAEGAQILTGNDWFLRPVICVRLIVDGRLVWGIRPEVVVHKADRDLMYHLDAIAEAPQRSYAEHMFDYKPGVSPGGDPVWSAESGEALSIDVAVPYLGRTYRAQATMTVQPTATPWWLITPTTTSTPESTPTATMEP